MSNQKHKLNVLLSSSQKTWVIEQAEAATISCSALIRSLVIKAMQEADHGHEAQDSLRQS